MSQRLRIQPEFLPNDLQILLSPRTALQLQRESRKIQGQIRRTQFLTPAAASCNLTKEKQKPETKEPGCLSRWTSIPCPILSSSLTKIFPNLFCPSLHLSRNRQNPLLALILLITPISMKFVSSYHLPVLQFLTLMYVASNSLTL